MLFQFAKLLTPLATPWDLTVAGPLQFAGYVLPWGQLSFWAAHLLLGP